MKIKLSPKSSAEAQIKFITPKELEKNRYKKALNNAGFEAKSETTCFLYEKKILFVGIEEKTPDEYRTASATAIRTLKKTNFLNASIAVEKKTLHAIVEGLVLGGYEFNKYKSESKNKKLTIELISSKAKELQSLLEEALIVANATNFTRDIVNTIPQDINPKTFAELAKKLAKQNKLTCNILEKEQLQKENCNAMLAVGRASTYSPRLIHLAYKPKNAKKKVTLVGKGLTYDSGGLSLKPATSMVTMKMDKAGACATLGIIKAVSELQLPIEVHVFIGAVENMIGGNAYKPDDILKSRSGKTIEVRNTDAEGRLVLADVLDYAQDKVKDSDYLFDFATLTGACMVALGQYTTGVMGHSSTLKHQIGKAASKAGELTGSLPFNKHLRKLLKSEIADICNIASKPYGGAITAGLFLDSFIKDENKEKWLHFDIAGSAYTESPWDVNNYGGTGAGVRMMSQFIKTLGEK
ncbi:MAG: leucyl aminopeptidase [Epsilonproteobacteria bacterium]|nr:leucyl aminopeptidase [Campylobacterota bacterium]